MMAASLIHAQANILIGSLDSISSEEGFRSNYDPLSEIKEALITLSKILLDAEMHGKLENVNLDELREVLYDLDDVLDTIRTEAWRNAKASFSQVSGLFSKCFRWGKIVQNLAEKLDGHIQSLRHLTARKFKTKDKCFGTAHIYEPCEIVGRDIDKEHIIDMLLSSDVAETYCVSIVGMGGLGKTTLAQKVFNDARITSEFSLRMWVCVPDLEFDIKSVLSKILNSLPTEGVSHDLGLTQLKGLLRNKLSWKKYLLVLDDVWNEDRVSWLTLKNFLLKAGGTKGRMLVTTRSAMVAEAIGNCDVYMLQGLSKVDSWTLFRNFAFQGVPDSTDESLVHIGKRIVEKCACVPLAIKVIGSLLNAQGLDKWHQIEHTALPKIDQEEKHIIPILKLSFDHLSPPLKACFVYCSLFPKGHVIDKKRLISMWMAQGYVHPVGFQSFEEVGERYFMSLLQKSFFQSIRVDLNGEIASCKMHDLIHDLAQAMAGHDFQVLSSNSSTIDKMVRHLSIVNMEGDPFPTTYLPRSKGTHTLLNFSSPTFEHVSSILKLRRLRVLSLGCLNLTSLPHCIGALLHLRCLDLSYSSQLEALPNSVANLCNLQTLRLSGCSELRDLPSGISKLVKLRHLYIQGCDRLTHMPSGMRKFSSLCVLDMFVVGDANSVCNFESLEDLRSLTNLRGELTVRFLQFLGYHVGKSIDKEYLRAKKHLTDLYIQFSHGNPLQLTDDKNCEALLECLEPHPNLKSLVLTRYAGVRFRSWASLKGSENTSSNLVHICVEDCPRLQYLPIFSRLCHLRHLKLYKLEDLEYVECDSNFFVESDSDLRSVESPSFFACLESLKLVNLPKLRGWSRSMELHMIELQKPEEVISGQPIYPAFPRLCQLNIEQCPKLTSLPICENTKQLHLYNFNDALKLIINLTPHQQQPHSSSFARVTIDNVAYLKFLSIESCKHIASLIIHLSDMELLSLDDVFAEDVLSLQSLQIRLSPKLKSISGMGWKRLVALESLRLSNLPNLYLSAMTVDGEEDLAPWNSLQGLRHLELDYLPKLVKLPKGIQYLRFLRTSEIRSCHNLKELPEWIGCLGELQSLYIEGCTELKCLPESMLDLTALRNLQITRCSGLMIEKCRQPDGEDWPKIQHIPHIRII